MTNEIAKKEMCLLIRSGVEIWVEEEKAIKIGKDLESSMAKFLIVDGNYVNTSDIVGIFTPKNMDELKRRKQGQWKCKHNNWQPKDISQCSCGQKQDDWTGGNPKYRENIGS